LTRKAPHALAGERCRPGLRAGGIRRYRRRGLDFARSVLKRQAPFKAPGAHYRALSDLSPPRSRNSAPECGWLHGL